MSQATWMQWAQAPAAFRCVNRTPEAGALREGPSYPALAATCAIQALLLYGLGRIPESRMARADRADDALEVVWIERPEAATADAMRIPPEAHAARRRSARPQRERSGAAIVSSMPSPLDAAAASAPSSQAPVVADDAWRPMPGAGRSSASDIDPSAFRRDPLARRDTSFDPKPAALEEAIQDRSFGGWMQAATRKRMCGDLRAALRRSPESTASIIESMRRRGCRV
ncbi:hypothetical protein [Lysobacter brunescens]|uniref:hypothetical protein n=1 Tax=Lysobacter brunescens TaxID=262323 RepID=UPI0036DEB419